MLRAGVLLSGVLAAGFSAGSPTGGIVYDPTNHVENITTAMSTLEQYRQDLEHYAQQMQNLSNPERLLSDMGLEIEQYRNYVGEVEELMGSLDSAEGFLDNLHRDLAVSPYEDWPAYYEARRDQAERGDRFAQMRFDRAAEVTQSVDEQFEIVQEHQVNASSGFAGEVEGLEQLSTQMAMIQKQNGQLIQLSTAETQDEIIERENRKAQERELYDRRGRELMRAEKRRRESMENHREFLRSMGIEPDF